MTVEEKLEVNEVSMAHITVCSEEPYSRSGYFYNKTAFDENAFTFEDLFHEGAEKILQDQVT